MSAMNFATKSQSIKTKLIKFFVGLILLVVVIESVFNLFLLKPLVVYSKTQIIQNAFAELKSDYSSDLKEVETIAEKLQNKHGIKVVLFSGDKIIYSTGFSSKENFKPRKNQNAPDDNPITISLTKDEDCAKLSVENFGKKIEERDMEHLWDAFYKSDKARTRNGKNNVGLGLYIVRTIIEKHGGTYGVHNTEKGVAFWWKIPLCD